MHFLLLRFCKSVNQFSILLESVLLPVTSTQHFWAGMTFTCKLHTDLGEASGQSSGTGPQTQGWGCCAGPGPCCVSSHVTTALWGRDCHKNPSFKDEVQRDQEPCLGSAGRWGHPAGSAWFPLGLPVRSQNAGLVFALTEFWGAEFYLLISWNGFSPPWREFLWSEFLFFWYWQDRWAPSVLQVSSDFPYSVFWLILGPFWIKIGRFITWTGDEN